MTAGELPSLESAPAEPRSGRRRYSAAMHRREAILSVWAWILALSQDFEPLRVAVAPAEEPCFLGDDYYPHGAPLPDWVCVRTNRNEQ